jgi:hypothetical protein
MAAVYDCRAASGAASWRPSQDPVFADKIATRQVSSKTAHGRLTTKEGPHARILRQPAPPAIPLRPVLVLFAFSLDDLGRFWP